ncbi:MAG: GMC family oxidoreductase N-terminal domain-containing protein, partial [Pseudomonadales bacterium]
MAAPDYLVIGAGSAGCVLARRLVDAGRSVTLVEAGPPDYRMDYRIHMPAALSHVLSGTTYNWDYRTLPEPHMAGRTMFCPRGKTLGGSSSINGMIYVRGHQQDFNQWAALSGYDDWRAEHCLPFFKRAESVAFDAGELRGRDGPMQITRGAMDNPLITAFLEAGQQAGHDYSPDLNGDLQEGIGPFDRTISCGRRFSTARGYLDSVRKSGLLTILTRTRVTRLCS